MPLFGCPDFHPVLGEGRSSHRASHILSNSCTAYSLMRSSPIWCLGVTARLPCRSQVPSVQFNVMQDVAQFSIMLDGVPVYCHGGHRSRDCSRVLQACELVGDALHHVSASAACLHCHAMSLEHLSQLGREGALVMSLLLCGPAGH
jgi:hypothetical protein